MIKKILLAALIGFLAVSCLDTNVVDEIYLEFANTKDLTDVKAKGDTIQFNVKWSGLSWVLFEDVAEGADTLAKGNFPVVGGRYDGYGNTTIGLIVPENTSSEDRESTLVLHSLMLDDDDKPTHRLTTKITQLGKR